MNKTDAESAFLGLMLASLEERISKYAQANRQRGEDALPLDLPYELRQRVLTLIAALDDCLEEASAVLTEDLEDVDAV